MNAHINGLRFCNSCLIYFLQSVTLFTEKPYGSAVTSLPSCLQFMVVDCNGLPSYIGSEHSHITLESNCLPMVDHSGEKIKLSL